MKSVARKYLASRAMASGLALILSILYSLELGPQNRGFITVIMTFSILTIVTLMGGTTLTARKIGSAHFSSELRDSYRTLIAVEIFVGLIVFMILIASYSTFKQSIPGPLILVSTIYLVSSSYHFAMIEWKIAQKKLTTAGAAEVITILIQIVSFFILLRIKLFSAAVNVLIAFAFAYFVVGIWCNFDRDSNKKSVNLISSPRMFFAKTRGHHSLGVIMNLLDRSDRIVISLLYPTAILAKYAAMGGVLTFLRFVPDALSKISVAGKGILPKIFKDRRKQSIFILIISISVFLIFARKFIEFSLGSNWLLPITTFAAFCLYELSRGTFQVYANKTIQQGSEMLSQRSVINVLIVFVFILPPFVFLFDLSGVPLSLAFAYLFGISILMRSKHG